MTYKEALTIAHQHAKACHAACSRALDLLDDEPLGGPGDDDVRPQPFDPAVDDNPQNRKF